jgi:hypothetical protein
LIHVTLVGDFSKPNEPVKPAGIFVSIVEYAATKEGWKLIYVKDSFSSLRTKLENREMIHDGTILIKSEIINSLIKNINIG